MSFFTALIAKPATGKSGGLKLVRRELRLLEEYRQVMPKESRLLNPATVEAMIHYLELYGTIICMWDESNQFLGSFGRYNAQGANYERSVYLECANAGDDFRRDLKMYRCCVEFPRISICLLGIYFKNSINYSFLVNFVILH